MEAPSLPAADSSAPGTLAPLWGASLLARRFPEVAPPPSRPPAIVYQPSGLNSNRLLLLRCLAPQSPHPAFPSKRFQPAGLTDGSRWSVRATGTDHRAPGARNPRTPKGCQNSSTRPTLSKIIARPIGAPSLPDAGSFAPGTLAPLWGASHLAPPLPGGRPPSPRPPAIVCQPSGLNSHIIPLKGLLRVKGMSLPAPLGTHPVLWRPLGARDRPGNLRG